MHRNSTEASRIAALLRSGLLEAESDETFLSLVSAAAETFRVPISTISLIDNDSQIYFENVGVAFGCTERSISFCTKTVERDETVVVLDTALDSLWKDNPLVLGDPFIRFYAGVPLRFEGEAIGTFCIIDTHPREEFAELQRSRLQRYALIANEMLEVRALRIAG